MLKYKIPQIVTLTRKNGRGHISCVRIQKKASGTSSSPEASIKTAATYSPTVTQYHRRDKA